MKHIILNILAIVPALIIFLLVSTFIAAVTDMAFYYLVVKRYGYEFKMSNLHAFCKFPGYVLGTIITFWSIDYLLSICGDRLSPLTFVFYFIIYISRAARQINEEKQTILFYKESDSAARHLERIYVLTCHVFMLYAVIVGTIISAIYLYA